MLPSTQGLSPQSKCVSFVCSQVLCYLPSKQGTSSLNFPTDSTCRAASSLTVKTAEGSHLFPPPPNVWRIHSTNAYLCLLYRGHRQQHGGEACGVSKGRLVKSDPLAPSIIWWEQGN